MDSSITGTALALHDLSLAANFGGSLYGKFALGPAVGRVNSETERREVLKSAWTTFNWVNGVSLAVVGGSWLIGRSMLSGREAQSRGLVLTKDFLTGTMVATGAAAIVVSRQISTAPQAQPDHSYTSGTQTTQTAQNVVGTLGTINMVAAAGVIVVTALLNIRAGRSASWSLLSRWLP